MRFLSTLNDPRGRGRRGNVLVTLALSLIVLLGAVGLGVDYAMLVADASRLQQSCDFAALAGALKLSQQTLEDTDAAVFIEGQANILEQPEFADVAKMKEVIRAFEEKGQLLALLELLIDAVHDVRQPSRIYLHKVAVDAFEHVAEAFHRELPSPIPCFSLAQWPIFWHRQTGRKDYIIAGVKKVTYRVRPETAVLTRGFDPRLSVGSARPPMSSLSAHG